jgi:antitoxin HicB
MLSYPVRLGSRDDGGVILTFPDIPEAAVSADSEEEAMGQALRVLETRLATYVLEGKPIPAPSEIAGAPLITTEQFSLLGFDPKP